jgi:hypothetical protein
MRLAILFAPLLFLALGSACDDATTVLVQYGCDTEDIVVETWDGAAATEVARFAPGIAPVCFLIAQSQVSKLHSRCASSAERVPVQIGVFDPAQECKP